MKEKISELLYQQLGYAYCDNCEHILDDSICEECHRKNINWSISKITTDKLSVKIIKIIKEDIDSYIADAIMEVVNEEEMDS